MAEILKYGLAVIRDGRLLLCRTRKYPDLIMPGGKPEGEESPDEGIAREISEELGGTVGVRPGTLSYFGSFEDEAAGKPGVTVRIELYTGQLDGDPEPSSEIAELVWWSPRERPRDELSAIVRNHIVPALEQAALL
jgi:8-oxo-dGTP diphosphatase